MEAGNSGIREHSQKTCRREVEMYKELEEKAKELGGMVQPWGINWGWVLGFPTKGNAEEFVSWLNKQGFDHRGVYPGNETSFNVRYR